MAEIVEIVETLASKYHDGKDNTIVTLHFQIERTKTTDKVQNDTKGTTGANASNEVTDAMSNLFEEFIKIEGAYTSGHGTIVGLTPKGKRANFHRIDQQQKDKTKHNIQFQSDHSTFANVVVYNTLEYKTEADLEVFLPSKETKKDKRKLKTVFDVEEIEHKKDAGTRIQLANQIHKYVAEALVQSFNNKLKYEIKVLVETRR